jgi:5-(carboxyamino)imidazole ribonucleotide mutase
MAIGAAGAVNAAIFAAQIIALGDKKLAARLARLKLAQARKVIEKDQALSRKQ